MRNINAYCLSKKVYLLDKELLLLLLDSVLELVDPADADDEVSYERFKIRSEFISIYSR